LRIIPPSFEIMAMPDGVEILRGIELAGRTCYKSEDKIAQDSAAKFVAMILGSGHHSVIEHISASVRIICDRAVTHEIVRHRLASYSQESTRYANYSKDKFGNEITVIKPCFWKENSAEYQAWFEAMKVAESTYMKLLEIGARPEQARSVLPNSLKTEIVMTCNLREWRHVFSLRCDKRAHPQMREIMLPLIAEFQNRIPLLFDDIYSLHVQEIQSLRLA